MAESKLDDLIRGVCMRISPNCFSQVGYPAKVVTYNEKKIYWLNQKDRLNTIYHLALEIRSVAYQALKNLSKAMNYERLDGVTSNRSFWGGLIDHESRKINFKVSQIVSRLSDLIDSYNRLSHEFEEARYLPDLKGAPEAILEAEIDENNPYYQWLGVFGNYWASYETHSILARVDGCIREILNELEPQIAALAIKIQNST